MGMDGVAKKKKELGVLFCYFGYIEASIPGRPAQWAISLFAILVLPIYWCWCRGRPPYPRPARWAISSAVERAPDNRVVVPGL